MSRTGWFVALGIALVSFWGRVAWMVWPVVAMYADPARIAQSWYVSSASMLPTLQINDRVRPLAVDQSVLRRGSVVLIAAPGAPRLYRVAAAGGDDVGVRHGRVFLNGTLIGQSRITRPPVIIDGERLQRWCERFPGELGKHEVLDSGGASADDFPPVSVPDGKLFLLGDNRDRAADSRYGSDELGVGLVDTSAVIGVVDRILRGSFGGRRARPIDAGACV